MVYHTHFKCNKKRLVDYPNMWAYARDIFQMKGVADTFNPLETRKHYYGTPVPRAGVVRGMALRTVLRLYTRRPGAHRPPFPSVSGSHLQINPKGIVAHGPELDFNEPHGRDKM